ncbi:anthocyanidin 3-O-glucosyltransferase 2-like [Macadamia integrifolia]|uniref:anthocyanidin 3-O-glucosyltransferase 2-like n=1 Tax=Macadamia integrifolia TaxID=60698 RepID=UPI001C4E7E2E|nr:anthocyanidin 3-O-glucosyltransferase 2-like [Macadamia integrifolia]
MKKKAELVFIPAMGIGHLVPMMEFAKRLLNRDDRFSITVFLIKPLFVSSEYISYTDFLADSVPRLQFIHLPELDPPPSSYNLGNRGSLVSVLVETHKQLVKHTITNLFFSNSDSESAQTRAPLAGLVIDLFCSTLIDIANEVDVPPYIFFTSTAGFLGLLLHLPELDNQINTDFKDSVTELSIPSFTNPVPPFVLPLPLWSKKDDGYDCYLYHGRRFTEAKGVIINSFAELEPTPLNSFSSGRIRPPPVYPVGPLIDLYGQGHNQNQLEENIKSWLDDQPPSSVVFLCFGSRGSFNAAQVKEIAIGLERSGHRFLWALRRPPEKNKLHPPTDYVNIGEVLPEGFLNRTGERGLVCGWVPQTAVLAHRAIGGFVSHCGWNSILEGMWFGVPIAAWPLYAEQHLNAFEMVKELGGLVVELRLDYRGGEDLVMAEEVERGVSRLMDSDCGVRMKVKEMMEKSKSALMDGGSSFNFLGSFIKDLMDED